jgi:SAM-dependent methyltransferase
MTWNNAKKAVRLAAYADMVGVPDLSLKVLEFGAFSSPMFETDEVDVRYADRLSTQQLRDSVTDPAKRSAIVKVDYVVDKDFDRQITEKFDLIVANHVVEHVPDAIGWMNRIVTLLRPGGHVFLTVPDKNYTFDVIRDPTLTRELISNFLTKRQTPSPADILDATVQRRDIRNGSDVWSGKAHHAIKIAPTVDIAKTLHSIEARLAAGEYIDCHCNVFTEASFVSVFHELEKFDFCKLQLLKTRPVQRPYNEFYALFGTRSTSRR